MGSADMFEGDVALVNQELNLESRKKMALLGFSLEDYCCVSVEHSAMEEHVYVMAPISYMLDVPPSALEPLAFSLHVSRTNVDDEWGVSCHMDWAPDGSVDGQTQMGFVLEQSFACEVEAAEFLLSEMEFFLSAMSKRFAAVRAAGVSLNR